MTVAVAAGLLAAGCDVDYRSAKEQVGFQDPVLVLDGAAEAPRGSLGPVVVGSRVCPAFDVWYDDDGEFHGKPDGIEEAGDAWLRDCFETTLSGPAVPGDGGCFTIDDPGDGSDGAVTWALSPVDCGVAQAFEPDELSATGIALEDTTFVVDPVMERLLAAEGRPAPGATFPDDFGTYFAAPIQFGGVEAEVFTAFLGPDSNPVAWSDGTFSTEPSVGAPSVSDTQDPGSTRLQVTPGDVFDLVLELPAGSVRAGVTAVDTDAGAELELVPVYGEEAGAAVVALVRNAAGERLLAPTVQWTHDAPDGVFSQDTDLPDVLWADGSCDGPVAPRSGTATITATFGDQSQEVELPWSFDPCDPGEEEAGCSCRSTSPAAPLGTACMLVLLLGLRRGARRTLPRGTAGVFASAALLGALCLSPMEAQAQPEPPSLETVLQDIEADRYAPALAAIETLIEAEPQNAVFALIRANIYFALYRLEEAEREFRRALQLAPDRVDTRTQLATMLAFLNREVEAEVVLAAVHPSHSADVRPLQVEFASRRRIREGKAEPLPDRPEAFVQGVGQALVRGDLTSVLDGSLHPNLVELLNKAPADSPEQALRSVLDQVLEDITASKTVIGFEALPPVEQLEHPHVLVLVLVSETPTAEQTQRWAQSLAAGEPEPMPHHVLNVARNLPEADRASYLDRVAGQPFSMARHLHVEYVPHDGGWLVTDAYLADVPSPKALSALIHGLGSADPSPPSDDDGADPDAAPADGATGLSGAQIAGGCVGILAITFLIATQTGRRRRR